jgi:hypothetical protein
MENNNENTYIHLQSLMESDHDIPHPKHDVIGWKLITESGAYIGEVIDLLYDTQVMTVRYLVIEITQNGSSLEGKHTLIPVGIATLHPELDEITLPNLHQDQLELLPDYLEGEVGPETEQRVRAVIGSPAALRMEETMVEFDQKAFYAHHHFDSERFSNRQVPTTETETPAAREQQSQTIHELIENSKAHGLHAADQETGKNTHHNEQHQIKPWLQPGASHNQGADDTPESKAGGDYLDGNRPPNQ